MEKTFQDEIFFCSVLLFYFSSSDDAVATAATVVECNEEEAGQFSYFTQL